MCTRVVRQGYAYDLPNLSHVVFRYRADDKRFVRIPGEVRDFRCVSAMDELEREDRGVSH